jgi:hypothetical protein
MKLLPAWSSSPRKTKLCACRHPVWDFNDNGRGFCKSCHGWERKRKPGWVPVDWEERREEHYSHYSGWDPGYGPDPDPVDTI